jgi:hypothetical protein
VPSTTESKALKTFTAEIGTGYFVSATRPSRWWGATSPAKTQATPSCALGLSPWAGKLPLQTLAEADKAYKAEISAYQAIAKSINLQAQ